ncbi:MAG: phosphoribosyl-ATP diphosphatase [Oscillospiraceae bacterium]|jgi:phosphoribosyl-ATP pyrophosphohydrolase|nr:phosphoribosyl-ATP diphosphatase [Oscillospiraceae bacterium]
MTNSISALDKLYRTVVARRDDNAENSYTKYLFEQGLDKILKKLGEECAETIIASKNADNGALTGEICDLLYHLAVLMAERGISVADVYEELDNRAAKEGNLKNFTVTDKNT